MKTMRREHFACVSELVEVFVGSCGWLCGGKLLAPKDTVQSFSANSIQRIFTTVKDVGTCRPFIRQLHAPVNIQAQKPNTNNPPAAPFCPPPPLSTSIPLPPSSSAFPTFQEKWKVIFRFASPYVASAPC